MPRHALAPAVLILLLWNADAAAASPQIEEIFAEQDTNRDGFIDRDEAGAAATASFRRLDVDGDDALVIGELDPWITQGSPGKAGYPPDLHLRMREMTMSLWDGDRSGRITPSEIREAWLNGMHPIDFDRDNRLSREEMTRFHSGVLAPAR
ncbi:hypothetical protein [Coralloluteibacterium stylophorae]|uniref:EF-hand domain-containing protein n=1 Tax=Coralloluteibacterium stylophorae TaxID=1776034 RepID=A0A8J7VUJ0_9GAMM|nr:hypothetical protein [Coralloluteibacterium stylophorae]MBS7458983.1 hypothetical protein [Coralloluteibacterium stylophorae]